MNIYLDVMNFPHIQTDTYMVGHSLELKIKSYNNSIVNLPRINDILYPNIEDLESLVGWLKSHSMYETEKEMAKTQNEAEFTIPQCVDWNIEDNIYEHTEINSRFT